MLNLKSLPAVTGILTILAAGCGDFFGVSQSDRLRATLGSVVVDFDAEPTYLEAGNNHLFELAEPVAVRARQQVISGNVETPNDVDVFALGPVDAGDRVIVSMTTAPSLRGAIAVFDETGSTLLVNDHLNVYLGIQAPFIDVVFRRPAGQCYVAVTATPGFNTLGEYVLGATIEPNRPIPGPSADTFILDFAGAQNVRIGGRSPINIPAFDAADIDARYAGMTDVMIEEIVRLTREDFVGLNLTILSTSEGDRPGGSTSRLHFGAVDSALLGVAEGVDEYNAQTGQRGIVYTESFAAFLRLNPTPSEMAQAIANVASHEIGHLLGLVHTEDSSDIMDVTASLNQLLRDQTFGRSPIYRIVFPIGFQDSLQLMLDSVGGDPAAFQANQKQRELARARAKMDPIEAPARDFARLGSCGLHEH